MDEIPYGYCQCGCGNKTKIAPKTNTEFGHMKGEPVRFIAGHNQRLNKRDAAERFWEKVDKRGPNDCWDWLAASRTPAGYGVFRENGRNHIASRYAYTLHYGPISAQNYVLHSCDNPLCCNPAHLRQGTQLDNVHDAIERRRLAAANFTDSEVIEWLHLFKKSGLSHTAFAKKHGICHETFRGWIDGRGPRLGVVVPRQKMYRYTDEQVLDLWRWYKLSGLSQRAFGKKIGLEVASIRVLFRRRGLSL